MSLSIFYNETTTQTKQFISIQINELSLVQLNIYVFIQYFIQNQIHKALQGFRIRQIIAQDKVVQLSPLYTVRKEIKCSGDSEILHGLVHDTSRISSLTKLFVKYLGIPVTLHLPCIYCKYPSSLLVTTNNYQSYSIVSSYLYFNSPKFFKILPNCSCFQLQ